MLPPDDWMINKLQGRPHSREDFLKETWKWRVELGVKNNMRLFLPIMIVLITAIGAQLKGAPSIDTAPHVVDPPLTQFAWLGQPVTFKVSYTNKSATEFRWQFNSENMANGTNRTFTISPAHLTNAGFYRVILSNSVGVLTSAVAQLSVRDWPQPTGVSFTNLSKLETNLQKVMRTHAVPGAGFGGEVADEAAVNAIKLLPALGIVARAQEVQKAGARLERGAVGRLHSRAHCDL